MAALLSPFKRFKKEPGGMLHGLQNQKKGAMLGITPFELHVWRGNCLSEDNAEIKLCTIKKCLQGNVL